MNKKHLFYRPFKVLLMLLIVVSCSSSDDSNMLMYEEKSMDTEILELLNQYRSSKGLSVLLELDIIKTQTHAHTAYMISKAKISHDNFSDRNAYLQKNANAKGVSENVASGYNTAQSVVNGWLNSEGHRKNIEGNYTHFNVSSKQNASNKWYYTNIFIKQ